MTTDPFRVPDRAVRSRAVQIVLMLLFGITPLSAQMVTGKGMTDFAKVFGLDKNPPGDAYHVEVTSSSVPGNILWPGDKLTLTLKVENRADVPLNVTGKLDVIAYGTKGKPGDIWVPTVVKIADVGSTPVALQVAAKGSRSVSVTPEIPARFGAYALVLDLGPRSGRQFALSCVRTFRPDPTRVQYPALSLDDLGPKVLQRLGVHAIRWGVGYKPTTDGDFERWYEEQGRQLKELHNSGVTVLAMFGGGEFFGPTQPLERPRPWLDAQGTMIDTKFDLAWLPSYDADFKKYVARFCADYGWPKGPITACSLWNEPWEGISISGWGADMLRYRDIYSHMVEGVRQAQQEAGADVLVGGGDSSSNALDKFFADGSDRFLPDFDFLSVHYQGMASFATYKPWIGRKGPRGRVRIWDTESWVANTDDRVAAVIAANRSAGYDRAMGIYGGNIHEGGNAWSTAAAVGAAQHFLGDRAFKELVFKNGLPWVMAFDGLKGNAEDGTVVVVGDLGEAFGADNLLFRTARGLAEVAHKEALYKQLKSAGAANAAVKASEPRSGGRDKALPLREAILKSLNTPETLSDASLTLSSMGGRVRAFDFYGNPVQAKEGSLVVPLDGRGFFLRGDGRSGSFASLLKALRAARIQGIEPLAVVAHDLTAPVSDHPQLRLTLTNVLNRPVKGKLTVTMGELYLSPASQTLSLAPNETRAVALKVTGGKPVPNNSYPLTLRYNAGPDGVAIHHEEMHVNLIAKRTVKIDGKLDDWAGVLPQKIVSENSAPTLTEAAWFPFKKFEEGAGQGIATGYLACDDAYFYFAAKIADSTPDGGTLRFADRDDDAFFYPPTSYVKRLEHPGTAPVKDTDTAAPQPLVWPEGVRRYSYRMDPILPSGNFPNFDNVQIAFNVLPRARKQFASNPPGTIPGYTISPDTDYEYALNRVAEKYGGGTEIWRLNAPGMPLKHFYPRQPKSPLDGPVTGGQLVVVHEGSTRIVEAAIPWSEIPEVKARKDAGEPIKFSFRVNDNSGVGCMELSRRRSVAKHGGSFHADWVEHWENQVEFGWGK